MKVKRVVWLLAPLWGLMLAGAVAAGTPSEESEVNRIIILNGRAWLGVRVSDVTAETVSEQKLPGEYGALIEKVEKDSPAAEAGLEKNDVILSFDGERVRSVEHLRRLLRETPPGRTVSLQVSRAGGARSVEVTPRARRAHMRLPQIHIPEIQIPPVEIPEFSFRYWGQGPRLGITADAVTSQLADYFGVKQGKGVLVREVLTGSAAEKGGLKAGDVIVRVDDKDVGSVRELRRSLRGWEGKEVNLTIVRNRQEQTVKVKLEEPTRYAPRRTAAVEVDFEPGEEFAAAVEAQAAAWEERLERWEEKFQQEFRQRQAAWERQLRQAEEKMQELEQKMEAWARDLKMRGRT